MRRFLIILVGLLALSCDAVAQQQNNNAGGILISPDGVLANRKVSPRAAALHRKKMLAQAKQLDEGMQSVSELRKVSLPALEAKCQQLLDDGQAIPVDVAAVAGLQRIDYVFVFPDTGELVIAGPAEPFATDTLGRTVGVESGRPTLRLDDLVVALRSDARSIGCSIDPNQQRVNDLNRYLASNSNAVSMSVAKSRFSRMAKVLGQQDVRIFGVPANSHFGLTLLEADYRMKLVNMGLENPKVRGMPSYLSMMRVGTSSMQRWWFAPLYDGIECSDDRSAWKLTGQRVQLMTENEATSAGSGGSAITRVSADKYCQIFTNKYGNLAERMPVFAELQNLFDLAVTAALIQTEQLARQAGWQMELFRSEEFDREMYVVPKHTNSIMNYKMSGGRMLVGLVGGGVEIRPGRLLRSPQTVARLAGLADLQQRPSDDAKVARWWWD